MYTKPKECKVADFNSILSVIQDYLDTPVSVDDEDYEDRVEESKPDKVDAYIDRSRLFILSTHGRVDIALRFYSDTLIVARMFLYGNQRKGWGTKIFDKIEEFARAEGFKGVEIETASTVEMKNFALKRNYVLEETTGFMGYSENYNLIFSSNPVNEKEA